MTEWMASCPLKEFNIEFGRGMWLTPPEVALGAGRSLSRIRNAQLRGTLAVLRIGAHDYTHIERLVEKYPDGPAAQAYAKGSEAYARWLSSVRNGKAVRA